MRDYERERVMRCAEEARRDMTMYVWSLFLITVFGLVMYCVTDRGLWLLACPIGIILPIIIQNKAEDIKRNSQQKEARKQAIDNNEVIYYCNNKLYLTKNNQLVYFDRLTSGIYSWPDKELLFTIELENGDDNLDLIRFSDIKVKGWTNI